MKKLILSILLLMMFSNVYSQRRVMYIIDDNDTLDFNYPVRNKNFVKIIHNNGKKYKGKITLLSDSLFMLGIDTFKVNDVANIQRFKKGNRYAKLYLIGGGLIVGGAGALAINSAQKSTPLYLSDILISLIGLMGVEVGTASILVGGTSWIITSRTKNIKKGKNKLIIKTFYPKVKKSK